MAEKREWYYAQYGKPIGPVSEVRFKELIENGTIVDQTYIWTEGLKDWIHFYESDFFTMPEVIEVEESMDEWFYVQNNTQCGPVDTDTLKQFIHEGVLTKDDYIWKSSYSDWKKIKDSDFVYFPEIPKHEEKKIWFYIESGKPSGPISEEEVQTFIQSGILKDTSYIWKYGLKDWVPYNQSELMVLPPIPSQEESWYYAQDGKSLGPISRDTFLSYIKKGIIDENTYVWKKGLDDWVFLKDIEI